MKYYYDVVGSKGSDSGPYWGRVYHYDETGNAEIVDWRSPKPFNTENAALDAASNWCFENNINAEIA